MAVLEGSGSRRPKKKPTTNPAHFGGVGRYAAIPTTSGSSGRASSVATTRAPARATAPPPPRSSAPAAAAAPKSTFDLRSIRDALAAITANFNLRRGQLTADSEATRRAFGVTDEALSGVREEAITGARSRAAGQGILRSGLFLNEVGEITEDSAKARAQALAERDARLRAIASNLAGLTAQEKGERVGAARDLAKEQLATKEQLAQALKLAGLIKEGKEGNIAGTVDKTPASSFSQGMSDSAYLKKYGKGEDAIKARIAALFQHRGSNPSQARIDDIYKRRGGELSKSFEQLRKDVEALAKARSRASVTPMPKVVSK